MLPKLQHVHSSLASSISIRRDVVPFTDFPLHTHLNRSSFCRFFKARTKKTLFQFLNEIRIVHACKKLTMEHKTITSICYETGYNNISHFNRQFKKVTGLTAKEYAKKYSNSIDPWKRYDRIKKNNYTPFNPDFFPHTKKR